MRRLLLVLGLALSGQALVAAPDATGDSPAVTAGEIRDLIRVLAADEMEGREAGTPGSAKAVAWIAERLADAGLVGAGENGSFLQPVPIPSESPATTCALEVKRGDGARAHVLGRDFIPFLFSETGDVTAEVAFAGYGITAEKLGWDDYEGLDVKDRVVLVFRHEPHEGTPRGQAFRRAGHSTFDRKIRNAHAHGAVAVLVVNDPLHHETDALPEGVRGRPVPLPAAFAKRAIAGQILGVEDLAAIQKEIDGGKSPSAFSGGDVTVHLRVAIDRTPRTSHNVVAILPGSDARLAREFVIVGAHHDHLGRGGSGSLAGPGEIHNGADDNASGTAAVLEIVESLAREGTRPMRSVLAVLFTGEEKGLLGSRHYVEHPVRPLESTVAMLNLDMVGRSRDGQVFIGGVGTSPGFRKMLEPRVAKESLRASYGSGGAAPSDHFPFYRAGIPTLFFFTGIHGDYHRPTDDWEKIEADGTARIARLAAGAIRAIANDLDRPAFRRTGRAYLGVMAGSGGEGALVQRVIAGTPAGAAGLRSGDRILAADDTPISSWADLRTLLGNARPGDAMVIEVRRAETRIRLRLVLGER